MNNKVSFLPNGYFNHLQTINNVSFTAREIDVLSCLFNLRGASKIAFILDITIRTTETHINNIKRKINNSSREGIIDFIEKSGKSQFTRKHYINLLIQADFKKRLKQFYTIIYNKNSPCCFFYLKDKRENPITTVIQSHLKLVGVKLIVFSKEEELLQNKDCDNIIYVVANQIENKFNISKVIEQLKQKPNFIIICIKETTNTNFTPQSIELKPIIYINQENYYLAFIELLKKLFPKVDFTETMAQMCNYHQSVLFPDGLSTETSSNPTLKLEQPNPYGLSNDCIQKPRWLMALMIIGLFGLGVTFYSYQTATINIEPTLIKQKNSNSVLWNLPRQDHIFIGRKKLLDDLANKLHTKKSTFYPTDELLAVSVFAGLGGVGKTQLALQYIHHSKHPYTLKAWFLAENIEQLKQQYIDFAKTIGYKSLDTTVEPAISYVKTWLLQNPGWILVFDNVTNYQMIKNFLPTKGGWILLTTRQRKWPNTFKTLNVDLMDEEESIALMQSLTQRQLTVEEVKSQKELVKTLGYLPLALAHAGAYIRQSSLSITNYLEIYKHNEQQLLADNTFPEGTNSLPVAVTWNISLENIIKECQTMHQPPLALHLLSACAYLAPDKIPKELLLTWLKEIQPNLAAPKIALQTIINQLWQYSIVNNIDEQNISIHRLVQAAVRIQHKKLLQEQKNYYPTLTILWYSKLLKSAHNEFYKDTESQALQDEIRKGSLFPHLQSIAFHHEQLWPKNPTTAFGEILFDIASVLLYNKGDPVNAKLYYKKALVIFEQHYGMQHEKVAITLNNLGNAYGDLGDSIQQKNLLERALKIFKRSADKNHIQIATTLTNLANAYGDLGNYQLQKELLESVLVIFKEHYGKEHLQVAITMANLGNACGDLGDPKRQKELLETALAIFERECGSQHVQVASALVSLGSAYGDLGQYKEKKAFLKRALNIEEQFYGKDHIEVATTLVSFANSYGMLGNAKKQKEILERALTIFERDYGKDHVQTSIAMANLANAYGDLGNHEFQKKTLEQVLTIQEQYYGKNHIEVGITLNNLGNAYGSLGCFERQKELLERSLKIKESYFGKNHTEVAITLINLGSAFGMLGYTEKQIEALEQSLSIFIDCYGQEHIQLANTLNNLGNAYGTLKNYKRQKELLENSLKIATSYYGVKHPRTSFIMTNLGSIRSLFNVKQQKEFLEQALNIKEIYFGKNHLQVGITLANLSNVYGILKNYHLQVELLNNALIILEKHYRKDNIMLAPVLYNLATAYINLKDFSKAYDTSRRSHEIYSKIYGIAHEDTKDTINLIATIDRISSNAPSLSEKPLLVTKQVKNDQLQANYQIPHGKDRMQAGLDLFQKP